MHPLHIKRVYDPPADGDGMRVLVDRLWPRGISREKGRIDQWLRDIAPSDDLRKRFHAKPDESPAFRTAYVQELEQDAAREAVVLLRQLQKKGPVTLLYAARDETHNNATALKAWLDRQS